MSIVSASLSDFPHFNRNFTWSFETAAKADTGHIYGTVQWGFSITDAAKGTLGGERVLFIDGSSATFDSAVAEFNKFYKAKGTPGAP
jgi:hypothetical protein